MSVSEGAIETDIWFETYDTYGVFYDVTLTPQDLQPQINVEFNTEGLVPAGGPQPGGGVGPGAGDGGANGPEGIFCANAFLDDLVDLRCEEEEREEEQ